MHFSRIRCFDAQGPFFGPCRFLSDRKAPFADQRRNARFFEAKPDTGGVLHDGEPEAVRRQDELLGEKNRDPVLAIPRHICATDSASPSSVWMIQNR